MGKINLALLSGGISSERDVSLNSGDQVFDALNKERYNIIRYDPKTDLARLVSEAPQIDAALIILHGPFGEDGTIQGLLELLDIPYQGSGVIGSSVAMNKLATKQMYELAGLPSPPYMVLKKGDPIDTAECEERLGIPLVIKPLEAGSSVGMTIVKSVSEIETAAEKAFEHGDTILVEVFVGGVEITVGVIGNQTLEALPVIEIVPGDAYDFFDYEAKYTPGATREICPARISEALTEKAQTYAKMAHRSLFCEGYSRTDMIIQGDDIYILETNTIPGMTATSLLPQAAIEAGISFTELLDRLIDLGMNRHQSKRRA